MAFYHIFTIVSSCHVLLLLHLCHIVPHADLPLFWHLRSRLSQIYINRDSSQWLVMYFFFIFLAKFISNVFLTTILWAVLMMLYGYLTLLTKKFNSRVYEWKMIIPLVAVMLIYTIVCRVGFGS